RAVGLKADSCTRSANGLRFRPPTPLAGFPPDTRALGCTDTTTKSNSYFNRRSSMMLGFFPVFGNYLHSRSFLTTPSTTVISMTCSVTTRQQRKLLANGCLTGAWFGGRKRLRCESVKRREPGRSIDHDGGCAYQRDFRTDYPGRGPADRASNRF